ncbi:MAG TPA: FAD-binding domain [Caulobacter sp.]|nr:FAD-binding domain [Caulobacter sp.]
MKVLIVGAGIAGPTLAYWLLKGGHEVTLVEHAPKLRSGGYLIDFWGAGFDVAERMGIVPELRKHGYTFTEARAVDRTGRKVASFDPSVVIESNDRYLSIPRADLATVIYDALDGKAELIVDDTVRELDDDGERVRVTLESGTVRDFDLVAGADGLHSRVRRLAFGPDAQYEKYLGIVFAAFDAEGYPFRDELVAMMHAEVGFQAIRLSFRDDATLCLFTLLHDGVFPTDRASQEALLRAKLADKGWELPTMLDVMSSAKNFYFDSASQILMPSWSTGRVVLVGDAGAAPSFLAGQGSALAMIEAFTLAAELAGTDDYSQAFARYHARLAPLIRSKQKAAEGLGLAFAPKNRFQLFVRNTVLKMMGLPKVADIAMGRSFHDRVELPSFPEQTPAH